MAFYIINPIGFEMKKGKNFDTQDAAERAALKSVRISAASASGWQPLFVMERLGGNKPLSVIRPEGVERRS